MLFIVMACLLGIGIALYRRSPGAFLDGPTEDLPARLLRWAVALLAPQRQEWGRAMLGELGYLDGRVRRMRFALGCVVAALLLPPWGRTAAGVWALFALALGGVGLYASVAGRYGLGIGDWIAAAIAVVVLIGYLLGASALLRRPGVALPGLLGGVLVVLAPLTLSGFTFYDQIAPDIVFWHQLVLLIAVPFVLGAAGTLWGRDGAVGRRVARLAAISAGLGLYLYGTLAVAVLGAGGPPEDAGESVRFIVSDRLGNNLVQLLVVPLATATVGWAGAAATARLRPASAGPPSGPSLPAASPGSQRSGGTPVTVREETRQTRHARHGRTAVRIALLCAGATALALLAAIGWVRG
jgi:hypothetical protein